MMDKTIDVFGVGNAIVDTLAFVDSDFLRERDFQPGIMTLVDSHEQADLLQDLKSFNLELRSGGSAANTMIGIARCGGSGFYSSKVSKDPNGEFYRQDLLKAGLHFDVHPLPEAHGSTGTCVVLTTPDAERTMFTHLGVSTDLHAEDIDEERLKKCQFSYVEGYLWTGESTKSAALRTMELSRKNGVKTAFTFSDPWLVGSSKEDFREIVKEYCNIVFCNAEEAKLFAGKDDIVDNAAEIGQLADLVFVTNGGSGCIVVEDGKIEEVPGFNVKAIDTNGAGDAFAGGVLFGLSRGKSAVVSAKCGNYLASRVVQVHGARIEDDLKEEMERIMNE
ncbi:MAG: adenosine kinase [Spirochaetia bacterium]|nr:adenosine kinase [Spirochaetia bacterium]